MTSKITTQTETQSTSHLQLEQELALLYHNNSNLTPSTIMDFLENMAESQSIGHPRHYPACPAIALNPGRLWKWRKRLIQSLPVVLAQRKSSQNFLVNMPLQKLSQIILMSLQAGKMRNELLRQRPYPSAGGLYGVNVFVLATAVKELEQGIYNVNPDRQCLEQLYLFGSNLECQQWLKTSIVGEPVTKQAPVYIFFCANLNHVKQKYGERAYRFILLEAGHIAQNISLASTSLGISHLPLGGFCEKMIEEKIGDPDMIALYTMALG
ncbi:hypothetical protein MNBD_GAMMA12-3689 [hydrothermal vent metagenome]|uniref:Nitroreductase domain-containing protein n=1 Tax=hydrothermal vent metagenome TaxID=652676 RepID=A0A3B0YNJ3_9ZZZZ